MQCPPNVRLSLLRAMSHTKLNEIGTLLDRHGSPQMKSLTNMAALFTPPRMWKDTRPSRSRVSRIRIFAAPLRLVHDSVKRFSAYTCFTSERCIGRFHSDGCRQGGGCFPCYRFTWSIDPLTRASDLQRLGMHLSAGKSWNGANDSNQKARPFHLLPS